MFHYLPKIILHTIVFYDILDYPLTVFEVWKHLINFENREARSEHYSLGDVVNALEGEELRKHVEEFQGFYFLIGRKKLVSRRIQNDKNSISKYKIARRVAGFLSCVPFLKMIAITGTVAMKNCEKVSDIDFLVVIEKGRIFIGRLIVTMMVHLFGKRRHGEKIKNRVCLNYFLTTGSLQIKKKDLFAASEYSFIFPIYGWKTFQKFEAENAGWIRTYKPNCFGESLQPTKNFVDGYWINGAIQKLAEDLINFCFGDRIEAWLGRKQVARIEENPLSEKKGAYIEANKDNLVFLPEPQGPLVEEVFKRKIKALTKEGELL